MIHLNQQDYDVCIVGSGAGGGMAAYALTRAGARVVMLEAGPEWWATRDSTMLLPAYATPRRGRATKTRPFGEHDACDGGWEIEGEPYTRARTCWSLPSRLSTYDTPVASPLGPRVTSRAMALVTSVSRPVASAGRINTSGLEKLAFTRHPRPH